MAINIGRKVKETICQGCGKSYLARLDSAMKYCSNKCQAQGKNNPAYRGGVIEDDRGYKLVRETYGPHKSGKPYKYEHRLIVEKQIGRDLHTWEHVHHIDFNRTNNDPSNLEVMSKAEHHKFHSSKYRKVN